MNLCTEERAKKQKAFRHQIINIVVIISNIDIILYHPCSEETISVILIVIGSDRTLYSDSVLLAVYPAAAAEASF